VVTRDGSATHVIVPIDEYLTVFGRPDVAPDGYAFVPTDVARKVIEGKSPLRAWREHFGYSQQTLSQRMGARRESYSQMEKAGTKSHKNTLERTAKAMGIDLCLLLELYEEDPVSVPG
jgi:DNA-binding XRE family transcriptional regulator